MPLLLNEYVIPGSWLLLKSEKLHYNTPCRNTNAEYSCFMLWAPTNGDVWFSGSPVENNHLYTRVFSKQLVSFIISSQGQQSCHDYNLSTGSWICGCRCSALLLAQVRITRSFCYMRKGICLILIGALVFLLGAVAVPLLFILPLVKNMEICHSSKLWKSE